MQDKVKVCNWMVVRNRDILQNQSSRILSSSKGASRAGRSTLGFWCKAVLSFSALISCDMYTVCSSSDLSIVRDAEAGAGKAISLKLPSPTVEHLLFLAGPVRTAVFLSVSGHFVALINGHGRSVVCSARDGDGPA
jgi:hypothetical protein